MNYQKKKAITTAADTKNTRSTIKKNRGGGPFQPLPVNGAYLAMALQCPTRNAKTKNEKREENGCIFS